MTDTEPHSGLSNLAALAAPMIVNAAFAQPLLVNKMRAVVPMTPELLAEAQEISTCGWYHEQPDADPGRLAMPDAATLAACGDIISAMVAATLAKQRAATEAALRTHVEGHKVEEWMREIAQLKQQLTSSDDCRRCHGEPPFGFTCNTCGAIGTLSASITEI